ncbi:MAG: exodeoxyribonuclease VII large subunit [Acidobacteriota bacterium]
MNQISLNWAPERRSYSVSELTAEMRALLADGFTDIWVAGEISGVKLAASGHYYFTLKDAASQLRSVCYRMTARYLKFKPQDGMAVLARGRVDLYDARGELQFLVETLEPQGHGALQLAFDQLKKKLAAEGLFETARKRSLPPLPERIGIVTSPTGAVIRDMLHVLERRCPGRHIRIYPVQVQGDVAAGQIATAIDYFSQSGWPEVIILARGGGSLEDLWAFNEERVARAIAQSSIPIISAVGHETDFTIADFVADLRAPTPSAAAELVIQTRASLVDSLTASEYKLRQVARLTLATSGRRLQRLTIDTGRLRHVLGRRLQRVDELDYELRDRLRTAISRRKRTLDDLSTRLVQRDVRLQFSKIRRRVELCEAALLQSMRLKLSRAKTALGPPAAHLEQLSPLKILDRGYAIVEQDGRIVKSPEDAPEASAISIRVAKGTLKARVTR